MFKDRIRQIVKSILYKVLKIPAGYGVDRIIKNKILFIKKLFYRKKYSSADIVHTLKSMGVHKGSKLMIHTSWGEFYNYTGTPKELILAILELIGHEGTLAMPAYGTTEYFDVRRTPSSAGLLTEIFRRMKGVKRSVSNDSAVCATGPLADEWTYEHLDSVYGFDTKSPYFKFSQSNGDVVLIGLGRLSIYFSVLHCIDYLLMNELQYFNNLMSKNYLAYLTDYDGNIYKKHKITRINSKLNKSLIQKMYKNMPRDSWAYYRLSNLDIVVFNAKQALQTGIEMARRCEVIYSRPYPKKSLFVPVNPKKGEAKT